MPGIFFIILLPYIVLGIIFGVATNAIIRNKGYNENWFWWGFFFGIIALIVAASKPTASAFGRRPTYYGYNKSGWKCDKCGKYNSSYVSTCSCGNRHTANGTEYENSNTGNYWICQNCGRENPKYQTTCKCGCKKENNNTTKDVIK